MSVLRSRPAQDDEELGVVAGEEAEVLQRRGDGWLLLERNKERGWLPPGMTQEVSITGLHPSPVLALASGGV